ncbi:amidohydrolase family protein [Spirillospora sp. CA-255316]
MGIVDVHAHLFPLCLLGSGAGGPWPRLVVDDETSGRLMVGDDTFRNVRSALWDVSARLAELDAHSIDMQVVSPVPVTLDTTKEAKPAADYLRALNEGIAAAVAEAPDRLVGLGGVPLQDVGLAVAELDYLVTELDLVGAEIGCGVAGRELDDPELLPFFAAAEALGAVLFVHPLGGGEGAVRRAGQPYDFGLGMLTDTALAAGALVFGGVLDACPRLRVVLAHGCGTFPWAYPRLALGTALGGDRSSGDHAELIRRLWVDTLVFDPEHIGLLARRFGADHVLVGSDHPFMPGQLEGARDLVAAAVELGGLTADEGQAALGDNARALFGFGHGSRSVRG